MVIQRRFGPLVAALVVGLALLIARLYFVQVVEHGTWAREAANLVRSAHTVPYHRGKILDRNGLVLVHDEEVYDVELVYRDFRRDHLLGQVAHARSALEGSSVSLERTLANLGDWALELVRIRPAELDAFERGAGLELAGFVVPPAADAASEQRRGRAEDLRFYLRAVLGASAREWNDMRRLAAEESPDNTYVELFAKALRGTARSREARVDVAGLEAELELAARRTVNDLGRFAELLELRDAGGELPTSEAAARALLVYQLDVTRTAVEDSVATQLFRAAAGFEPGRLPPELVGGMIDLGWIRAALRWTPQRADAWLDRTRAAWLSNWEQLFVPGARIRAELRSDLEHRAQRLLSELAGLFGTRGDELRSANDEWVDWRELRRVNVLDELADLFADVKGPPRAQLPFEDAALHTRSRRGEDPWVVLEAVLAQTTFEAPDDTPADGAYVEPADGAEAVQRLRIAWEQAGELEGKARGRALADRREVPSSIARAWQRQLEAATATHFAEMQSSRSAPPWKLSEGRIERAREQRRYAVIDRGSRPQTLAADPSYDVVHLLTRYPDRFRGFHVRERMHRRAVVADAEGQPPAGLLLGNVRASTLRQVLAQQEMRRRLIEVRRKTVRASEDLIELEDLVTQIYRNDELHGSGGIEGLLDEALRGSNGFREKEGLQEREARRGGPLYLPPIDGKDVVLTIDARLQLAAEEVLDAPHLPDNERLRDEAWFGSPVGAICIVTVDGEVLAAASTPREPRTPKPGRDGQDAVVIDRTLQRPRFQPLGSVFKVFAAVYALELLGLDATRALPCETISERGAGWIDLHCWHTGGHGSMALHAAIRNSCNAYFAQLGDFFPGRAAFVELCHAFGFDEPTGVRAAGQARSFREHYDIPMFAEAREWTPQQQRQAANGLTVIEGTPLQVARAMAGLATGVLPELRLVRAVGDEAVPVRGREVPFSSYAMGLVRRAMSAVVAEPGGSAFGKGLDERTLGFRLAAKTGSADYLKMDPVTHEGLVVPAGTTIPDQRKHTWLMGYFPADEPRFVIVVYLHDVAFTSSHTAVHVASQMLQREELRAVFGDPKLGRVQR